MELFSKTECAQQTLYADTGDRPRSKFDSKDISNASISTPNAMTHTTYHSKCHTVTDRTKSKPGRSKRRAFKEFLVSMRRKSEYRCVVKICVYAVI